MRRLTPSVVALLPLPFLVACGTTALTRAGSAIRTVTLSERDCCCESLGEVVAAKSTGLTTTSDIESVNNKLRNKAADLGGNAMYVVERHTDGNVWEGSTSSGVAEALRCDFDRIRASKELKRTP